ncbi:MAG: HAMP domain-containing histidine kinase [Microscillaceae bacterium]|nr:HAMP domain-containing histidine kinase [Microscillaceae bacterium]MDW8459662.1 HAMP domain-containing sensor histidine kinase [Cytophagales bacterium]
MKFLTRITLYNILLTFAVFSIGGVITYFTFISLINEDINRFFERKERFVLEKLAKNDTTAIHRGRCKAILIPQKTNTPDYTRDTTITHPHIAAMNMPTRKKIIEREVEGKVYRITMYKSLEGDEAKLEAVVQSILYLFLTLLLLMIVFNYFIARSFWKPFHHTLQEIKNFNLKNSQSPSFQPTRIKEFAELNHLLSRMTDKMRHDYKNLKEFTENASHEIQTPLAIIKNKLEILLDSDNLCEEQVRAINAAYQSADKLSKLSRTLALITKIENQEFSNITAVDFRALLENNLYNFKELIELKAIELQADLKEQVFLQIDPTIADILISNLLKNAINHNIENGKIHIELNRTHFLITNTGLPLTVEPDKLFERFQKNNPSSNSLGLGLSIIKKICEVNQFKVRYNYTMNLHQLEIQF